MTEPERWHWCPVCEDSTAQTVELVQDIPWWACSCGTLVAHLDETGAELSAEGEP
jgi:hypothetical protein